MDEFESFLKSERRKGFTKTTLWITFLLVTTFMIISSVCLLFDSITKVFIG